ncbi:hypothetical protein BRARA_B03739 [Brassica rapa]|uniref:Protein kinase domain-containing protein n=1 Tax=Brassica campestris TaxID=3711 RepID=A0A398AG86_BRACM|nr:hypothetical protein BRARA_B03739 [Brassica rapa]
MVFRRRVIYVNEIKVEVLVVLSQNIINGSVPVGESLTALDPSKSPVHALGFRKIQPNGGFNLSIWFYKTPNTTIVWHAQDVNRTSGLVPAVRMTDAGNFRLLSKDSSKDLWSSFDNPTDTLLPLRIQAYGIVYKGVLKVVGDSQVTVAVKKLDRVVQEGEKEFRNEVKAIGQTYHKNLVRLIDFCNEGQSRLIVYEYLPHGMLASRAHPRPKDRRRIAVEISRGILYLHEECCEQIIHCDIKPQNILLDESYSPRISDSGLAKLLRMNQTNTLTNICGTIAMEWFRNNPISSKVDVYCYGVMLLEIVCCKKAVDLEDNVILINWAYDCFRNRRLGDLMEDDLGDGGYGDDLSPSRSTINHKRQWSNNIGWSLAWSEPDNICAKRFGPYVDSNELRNLACGFNTICIYQRPKCEWAERFLFELRC